MKKTISNFFILVIGIATLSLSFLSISFFKKNPSQTLLEAELSYAEGQKAKDAKIKSDDFNRSLENLLNLETIYEPLFGNGKLYYNIGNNFFQLEEYALALLYYYRAEQLRKNDPSIENNKAIAQQKLGLTDNVTPSHLIFFSLDAQFSLPERLQILAFINLLFFVLLSLYLWLKAPILKLLVWSIGFFAFINLGSIIFSYAFSPLEAIIIKSSLLYRDPDIHYTTLASEPLLTGQKVKLLETSKGGRWLKIETIDGSIGYLPESSLRAISKK